ncbi:uncharacterized protein LOC136067905 [Quercus suber]|uniref:uncharacterized protein LOC136067905 n=1 Tax=Quercus suber TaxID=58331 RepID=UPI0032DEAC58
MENVEDAPILENVDAPILENVHFSIPENVDVPISQTQFQRVDLDSLDYDPGTRKQIWEYHVNQRDEIRRAYIIKDAAYCLPCFVFNNPNGVVGQNTFTVGGFRNWKKVGGKDCSFQTHIGKEPNSAHRVAEQKCKDLMNQWQHLQRVVDHFTTEQIANNRLHLKAVIFTVRYLAFQAIAFRGRDESCSSLNRGNFFESLAKVKKAIREEIGDAKFCIMVDEARDESMREQMAVVFRYVDAEGFVKERFFGLIHVADTAALTLKKGIYSLLSQHCLDIQNIRGQGYDGASNMRVLQNIIDDAIDGEHRAEAESAYEGLTSFEFVFILHLEKETMEITDKLCQALQSQSQDILNARHLVSSTKALIQKFRDDGWDGLLTTVISFCEKHCIDVLDMNARYVPRRGRARNQQDNITIEHHYRVNIFYATIDSQLQELNYRFNEDAMELLRLSSALEPREALKSFRSSDLCLLVENFYPQDFTDYDKQVLKKELYHFEHNVVQDPEFKELKSLSELSQWLVRTKNSEHYKLVYRIVTLVLTLPVSTATTERAFSAMKIVKTNLRNKMEDDFLTDSLMLYIEKDISSTFSLDSIVDDFENLKERRVPFS